MTHPLRSFLLFAAAALPLCLAAGADHAWAQATPAAAAAPSRPSLTVTTDPVRRETVTTSVGGTGLVQAQREVTVSSQSGGLLLTEVSVREGERVSAGQVIARLDGSLLEAQIAQQDATIASAEATLASAISANQRGQRLAGSGSLSKETAEERETAVKTARAALAQAQAGRETLRVQLDRTIIKAPFAGIVSSRPAVPGTIVQTGGEILRLQENGALEAQVEIAEQHLSKIGIGDQATITGPGGQTFTAEVSGLPETVDSTTHLGTVDLAIPAGTALKAGMFVRAAIAAGGTEQLTVAQEALTWRDGRTAVFTVSTGDRVALKPVEAGLRQEGRVAIAGDVAEGERVVTSGAGFLSDGNTVRVVTRDAVSAASDR
ncbi:efflux RND transporter periplasmic adaptor subunit [Mangrovicella endophytica]|uniref:efflux RND transporter periplasmic adaptor subunit n=1 Tax=Mangrovicella endophytica TaxID=2066697 RepID=UPI000C9E3193|nr:efflux RND transporter periplasmic adaptor subunit [Mangrovicella endophytica]